MRPTLLLSLILSVALAGSASAQSTFSNSRKPAAAPATVPAVTVTKPGSNSAAADSDVRSPARTTPPRSETRTAQAAPAAPAADASNGRAVFRPGDSLDMRVSGIPNEDSGSFPTPITIGADGMINVTYAGQIRAAGLTQSQLEKALEKRFVDEKIFRWPTVTINVMNQQRFVTIGGNVRAPGRQIWTADLTLMTLVAMAGGPSDFAGDKINLIRGGTVTLYRYKALKKNPNDDPKLVPGDQVDFL